MKLYSENLFGELDHKPSNLPITVPCTLNGKVIGESIVKEDGSCETKLFDFANLSFIKDFISFGIAGYARFDGDVIKDFSLHSVNITPKIK